MSLRRRAPGSGRTALLAVLLAVPLALISGCTSRGTTTVPKTIGSRPPIRVTSFDFPESRVLAEVYAAALQRRGYPVVRILDLGPREVVEPALEQHLVDLVPEYQGSVLRFLARTSPAAAGLPAALAPRGLVAAHPAPAQDRNGFAVTTETARRHGLSRISDLRPLARGLILGGPPECPQRPYCLPGLTSRYGLSFRSFAVIPTRAGTAEALLSGEIGVGMLETTDSHLADGRLVLLTDDRRLQPAENVVPVLRRQVLDAYGRPLVAVLDEVSAELTTPAVIGLNLQVAIAGADPAQVAAAWLDAHRL